MFKNSLLFTLFMLFVATTITFAQDTTSTSSGSDKSGVKDEEYPYPSFKDEEYKNYVPKRRQDQQDKFMDRKYSHPARPRDMWEIGLTVGSLLISGDVHSNGMQLLSPYKHGGLKMGVGGHIRKSFGYVFSLRANFMTGNTHGENWEGTQGWSLSSIDPSYHPNKSLTGNDLYKDYEEDNTKVPNYVGRNGNVIFYNYKTNLYELSISGILNLNNLRFHKRQTKWDLYGLAGIGGVAYRAKQDQLDGSGANATEYNYADASANVSGFYKKRKDVLKELSDLRDGEYESQAERHFDDYTPFKKYSYKPTAHAGIGLARKLSRRINVAVESRVTYTNDDLLDGQRWQEWGALTRDYDTYVYTGAHLNVNLGGKNSVEPLWWMNPLDYAYEELNKKPCCEDMKLPDLADDDNDGVPNNWDQEPNSREGCPVDTHGKMLDSDRDGVLDCDDHEPHSAYDKIKLVDEHGVAPKDKIKISCKDLDGDICDCARKCAPPPPPVRSFYDPCANPVLPSILFDLDKYSVKSEFDSQLAEVARIMRDCPNLTLCVVGHTDNRDSNSYNDVLSYKRAKEVIEKLVKDHGISRSRLTLQYRGENEPSVSGLSDAPSMKGIDADHALNRRVEFRICPPGGDMSKPKGPNAGHKQP